MKRKVIAICGGIGSGKSVVGNILRNCGYTVLDCDKIARDVADLPETVLAVKKLLGTNAATNDGKHIAEFEFLTVAQTDFIRWIVRSDVVTRVERVKSRDNVTGQNVSDIIARQSEPNVDEAVVIRNDGTLDRLKEAVFAALKQSGVTK